MTQRDISKRQRLAAAVTTLSAAAALPLCSAFGVVERTEPRSMENLVLGTVALPFVPGDPMQLLDDAYERGFYRFDLARTYGAGKSEQVFGKWLAESGVDRSSVHLVTKGGMGSDKYGNPGEYALQLNDAAEHRIFSVPTAILFSILTGPFCVLNAAPH